MESGAAMPEMRLSLRGELSGGFPEEVLETLGEVYRAAGRRAPEAVEIVIVEKKAQSEEELREEKARLGIGTVGDEQLFTTHDAWRGLPRITLTLEAAREVATAVLRGSLHHEAAHSILHGAHRYYAFKLTPEHQREAGMRGMALPLLEQLLYQVAISVKDAEATRLLLAHEFGESQKALALWELRETEEDRATWPFVQADAQLKLLFFSVQLKPLLFAAPLRELPEFKDDICRASAAMLSFMPEREREHLLSFSQRAYSALGQDTHLNVEKVLSLALKEL
ncbi:MAG: hypothetical protein ACE5LX_04365 [Nitrospinota bacterium]